MFKYSVFIVGRSENERTDRDGIGDCWGGRGHRCALDSTGTPCFVNYARVLSFFNWVPVNVCTSHINSTLCCVYTWQIIIIKKNHQITFSPPPTPLCFQPLFWREVPPCAANVGHFSRTFCFEVISRRTMHVVTSICKWWCIYNMQSTVLSTKFIVYQA